MFDAGRDLLRLGRKSACLHEDSESIDGDFLCVA
jgi:hypothetical protein